MPLCLVGVLVMFLTIIINESWRDRHGRTLTRDASCVQEAAFQRVYGNVSSVCTTTQDARNTVWSGFYGKDYESYIEVRPGQIHLFRLFDFSIFRMHFFPRKPTHRSVRPPHLSVRTCPVTRPSDPGPPV